MARLVNVVVETAVVLPFRTGEVSREESGEGFRVGEGIPLWERLFGDVPLECEPEVGFEEPLLR